ncbi:MAG: SgcJ/EcaC family oxidoreductase [Pirellulales bacterium]|nr:SgcJ/EcaC family oxidoreductase [Pirellulales bacterium]
MRSRISPIAVAVVVIGAAVTLVAADDIKPSNNHSADSNLEGSNSASSAPVGDDEQVLRAACTAYCDAVNKGDLDAVIGMWADDADFVADNGERIQGRDALKKMFAQHLQTMKGKTHCYEITSLRMIAPGVALEDGVATLAGGNAGESMPGTRYTALWKRNGDRWQICSVRDLGEAPAGRKRTSPLKGLNWLLGDWHSESADVEVQLSVVQTLDDSFIKQTYDVKPKNGEAFTVVTLIGWDPTSEQIRSWYFDSQGGFGDGFWAQDGNSWSVSSTGAIADGRLGTATNSWKFVDDNSIVWQATNRQLEGVPMPEMEVKFSRAQGTAKVNGPPVEPEGKSTN